METHKQIKPTPTDKSLTNTNTSDTDKHPHTERHAHKIALWPVDVEIYSLNMFTAA